MANATLEPLSPKVAAQATKIQTLIALLERAQQDNIQLRESLHKISQSDDKSTQLEREYREQLE